MSLRITALALPILFSSSCASGADEEFWDRLNMLCGKAFQGEIVSTDAVDDDWRAQRVVMHVRDCSESEIRIPLAVGDDRSRTWVLTRNAEGLALHHVHLHEDGTEDALTGYGGAASDNVSGSRQNFPADDATKALFDREGIPVSKANTWAIEVRPGHSRFAYELERPERFFRVEFDTSAPVEPPPPHWGE